MSDEGDGDVIFDMKSADYIELRSSISDISLLWSGIEHSLAMMFREIMHGTDEEMVLAVFFTPINAETRILMLQAAWDFYCKNNPLRREQVNAVFETLIKSVNFVKGIRNKIIHGAIVGQSVNGKPTHKIRPNLFDPRVKRGTKEYSAADVRHHLKSSNAVNSNLAQFTTLLTDARLLYQAGDWEAERLFRKKFDIFAKSMGHDPSAGDKNARPAKKLASHG